MREHRFSALDGWRGVAACMVALFHVRANGYVADFEVIKNAHLFVDFFFVLSGFVIAATYEERLAGGFSTWRFMLLRFGRLYPLHLAVLLAFVALDAARGQSAPQDFAGALVPRLLLLHGLGPFETRLWNIPSWTISTEFFAYLIFAFLVVALRKRAWLAMLAVVLVSPVILYLKVGSFNDTTGYEMVRCLYGFAAGVLAWHLFERLRGAIPAGTLPELLALAVVLAFVASFGRTPWSIAAPWVFALAVLAFAGERGSVSRVLKSRPFLFLGVTSYSIYMVHFFVGARLAEAVLFGKAAGWRIAEPIGVERWAGDALTLAYLAIVLLVSALTYRLIEAPARTRFRELADRAAPARAPA